MSRPQKEFSQQQFEALLRLNPTLKDTAAFFQVSEPTLLRRAKEWGYDSFEDARDQNMVHTKLDLIREAVRRSKSSDTMLIFSLKNLCQWRDKHEVDQKLSGDAKGLGMTITLNYARNKIKPDSDE